MTSVRSLVLRFAQNSVADGFPKIARSGSWWTQFFWTVVSVTGVVLFIVQGSMLVSRYFSYPSSVKMEVVIAPVPFPAVSVCSLRPIDLYNIYQIMNRSGEGTNTSGTKEKWDEEITRFLELLPDYMNYTKAKSRLNNETFDYLEADSMLATWTTFVANLDSEAMRQGGFQIEEMLVKCQYSGKKCGPEDWEHFEDQSYFNCYTFDPARVSDGEPQAMVEGPDHGLAIVLFLPNPQVLRINPENYFNYSLHSDLSRGGMGVRVTIHERGTRPLPAASGLDIPCGMSASVGIRPKEYIRLPLPHGNCTKREFIDGHLYSVIECKGTQFQESVVKSCDCADPRLPLPTGKNDLRLCGRFTRAPSICRGENITANFNNCAPYYEEHFNQIKCMDDARIVFSQGQWHEALQECPLPCREVLYNTAPSLSVWPQYEQSHLMLQDFLYNEKLPERFPPEKAELYFGAFQNGNTTFNDSLNFMQQKHFAHLNVHVINAYIYRTEEVPAYPGSQLLADLGGQLSVLAGMSIVTVIEFVELVIHLVRHFCRGDKVDPSDVERRADYVAPAASEIDTPV